MSSEKRLLLALGLSVVAVLAMNALFPAPPSAPRRPAPAPAPGKVEGGPAPAPGPGGVAPAVPPAPGPAPAPGEDAGLVNAEPAASPDVPFVSGRLHGVIRSRGASLGRLWIEGIPARLGSDPSTPEGALAFLEEPGPDQPGALAVTLESNTIPHLLDLEKRQWERIGGGDDAPVYSVRALEREREKGKGIVVEKRFRKAPGPEGWHLLMDLVVRNTDEDLAGRDLRVRVRGAALVHRPEGARDVLYGRAKLRNTSSPKSILGPGALEAKKERKPLTLEGDIAWVATASTYFAGILDPGDLGQVAPRAGLLLRWDALLPTPTGKDPRPIPQPSPLLGIPIGARKPGEEVALSLTFFVGPVANELKVGGEVRPVLDLEAYAPYKPVRDPGMFDLIGQGLFYVLKGFHSLVGNWGASIVLLTVLVRGLLFPLSRKQLKSTLDYSKKMQQVKPKLDALREKYGKDRQRMAQEQMKLFKEQGVPLMPGGCLLTFLQLPIWIALYGMLQYNFDLRHASFLWIGDLAQPEHITGGPLFPFIEHVPLVPNAFMYLNVLPLLMTATWFFASKATMTAPADPQQAQMQKMMSWMPFVMLLFPGFYDMPSGLCLYITASSTWGIVESRVIRRKLGAK